MTSLSKQQSGFKKEESYLDKIHRAKQLRAKNRMNNIDTFLYTNIMLEKAYDNVPRSELWNTMRRKSIKEK